MKRTIGIAIITALTLAAGCTGQPELKAVISSVVGDVKVNDAPVTAPGRAIVKGDLVVTGPEANCEITVNERNIFRLGKATTLRFMLTPTSGELQLEKGWFAGISKKLFSRESTYRIKTPTVVASIRGTSFCGKVEKPESTYFCVCNGSIELTGDRTQRERVTSFHHAARRFTRGADGRITIDANPGLLYHDDAGLEALAKKIGLTIDWTEADTH